MILCNVKLVFENNAKLSSYTKQIERVQFTVENNSTHTSISKY